jgi:hypothetical protein
MPFIFCPYNTFKEPCAASQDFRGRQMQIASFYLPAVCNFRSKSKWEEGLATLAFSFYFLLPMPES